MITDFFQEAIRTGALHMWFSMATVAAAVVFYAWDKFSMEIISMAIVSVLLVFFHIFPLTDASGANILSASDILAGFSNTALLAVVFLLIVGQAVVKTGASNEISGFIARVFGGKPYLAVIVCFLIVCIISAFLNNTPVVVIFIPILAALCHNLRMSPSKVMIPLSYAAIIGGMTTLLGSSTNLLVSGMLMKIGQKPLHFFDFFIPGVIIAAVGFIYITFIAPRLLNDRASPSSELVGDAPEERRFVVQAEVRYDSALIGVAISGEDFPDHDDVKVRMIQREEQAFIPPFSDTMFLRPGDTVIVSASRRGVSGLLSAYKENILPGIGSEDGNEEKTPGDINIAEVVIPPGSRLTGQSLIQAGFRTQYHCIVVGIQRRQRLITTQISKLRLMSGDVMLLVGKRNDITALQSNNDMILLEWSSEELHSGSKAVPAALILASVVGASATGLVPIVISSFIGALACLLSGCLNFRQLTRAIDAQIVLIIVASLAMGAALQESGGAAYIAHLVVDITQGLPAPAIMSVMFITMVAITNVLSNNASAVLFTPIAVRTAAELGAPIEMFIFAVIFACNCSFITPIGYQTNLLVMGPGHYKFIDYVRAGLPLALLSWITYSIYGFAVYG